MNKNLREIQMYDIATRQQMFCRLVSQLVQTVSIDYIVLPDSAGVI